MYKYIGSILSRLFLGVLHPPIVPISPPPISLSEAAALCIIMMAYTLLFQNSGENTVHWVSSGRVDVHKVE